MAPSEGSGWLRGLVDSQGKRSALLLVAMLVNFAIVFLSLLDVFDGAPTWIWFVVFAVELLVVFPLLALVLVGNLRERRARREQRQ